MDRHCLISLLDAEIAAISDPVLRRQVQAARIVPIPLRCVWEYGEWADKSNVTYDCWKVLAPPGRVGIVFCDEGFGPRCPWGLIWQDEDNPSMGSDSGWFSTLAEAAADALDRPLAAHP
jgi:hypothetical protein